MDNNAAMLREEQGGGAVMLDKLANNPPLAIGIGGFLTALAVGAYRFKQLPKGSKISLFLIQLRVTAQTVIIGSLTVGMAYQMLDHWVLNPKKRQEKHQ